MRHVASFAVHEPEGIDDRTLGGVDCHAHPPDVPQFPADLEGFRIERMPGGMIEARGVAGAGPDAFLTRVSELLATELEPLRPYYTAERSPSYLPRLLATYGLGPDGHGLPSAGTGQVGQLVRGAIRSTARSIYHSGVTTVAPMLRKLGSL